MSIDHQALAQQVVKAFADNIDPPLRMQIGKAGLEDLEQLVREALAEAVSDAVERMEHVVRELRSEAPKPDIGL